jgi:spermidine/putrescine transport system permease protein
MRRLHPLVHFTAFFAFALLYVPLLAVAVFSVNKSKNGLMWTGFTFDWYVKLFHNENILQAALNTLLLALISTVIATVLGTMIAFGLSRFRWSKKVNAVLDGVLYIPVVTPDIVFAVALVVAFGMLRMVLAQLVPALEDRNPFNLGMFTMIIAHVTFQISFVALVVRSRLISIDKSMDEAARDLFASSSYQLRKVTLPLLMPGIVSGAMLAFTLSLDDCVISFFTTGPGSATLPILIYAGVRKGVTPEIHALSTIVLLLTVILVLISERISRLQAMRDEAA